MWSANFIVFFVLSLLTIAGALFMISFTRVVHMVLSISLTFISIAGLYIMLDAEFLAFVQVLIYAGAISILMIFGIMMTKHSEETEEPKKPLQSIFTAIGVLGFFGIIMYAIQKTGNTIQSQNHDFTEVDTVKEIGLAIFQKHVIPFELISLLLTVALIGAIIIAKREEE
jgi:NADH-quinone oxidoreductase subunit J